MDFGCPKTFKNKYGLNVIVIKPCAINSHPAWFVCTLMQAHTELEFWKPRYYYKKEFTTEMYIEAIVDTITVKQRSVCNVIKLIFVWSLKFQAFRLWGVSRLLKIIPPLPKKEKQINKTKNRAGDLPPPPKKKKKKKFLQRQLPWKKKNHTSWKSPTPPPPNHFSNGPSLSKQITKFTMWQILAMLEYLIINVITVCPCSLS